jgi:dipeptidase D
MGDDFSISDIVPAVAEETTLHPALQGLEPATLWQQFDRLRRIPRPSYHEQGVRDFLHALASDHGWRSAEDKAGNVVIYVPGRGRGEGSEPLAIQGHMDMVCEKRSDVEHDFHTDPIDLRRTEIDVDGTMKEVLAAQGTTLGSDNGIGVVTALSLGLIEGQDHPPLELIFTTNEEAGMTGAIDFDGSLVSAKRLLNLDAEEDGSIYLSCAGGRELHARWEVRRQTPGVDDVPVLLKVSGLRGGHSGVDIHLGRANAILVLVQTLADPRVELDAVRLGSCSGGGRPNAVPRDAEAILWCARTRLENLRREIAEVEASMRERYAEIDPDLRIELEEIDDPGASMHPMSAGQSRALLKAIVAIPDGVIAWSPVLEGLVETSSNMGIVETTDEEMKLVALTRSSKPGAMELVQERAERALESSGASVEYGGAYPGWEAKTDTALLEQAKKTYGRLFAKPPEIKAIHAGLECGILGQRLPGVDMISFGPDIRNAHTPDEALVLDTMPSFWRFVSALVADLC